MNKIVVDPAIMHQVLIYLGIFVCAFGFLVALIIRLPIWNKIFDKSQPRLGSEERRKGVCPAHMFFQKELNKNAKTITALDECVGKMKKEAIRVNTHQSDVEKSVQKELKEGSKKFADLQEQINTIQKQTGFISRALAVICFKMEIRPEELMTFDLQQYQVSGK